MVSVLAAFTFASAIVMFMFARDIGVQVAKDQQTDLARYNSTVIVPAYAATIEADQNTITTDQGEISRADQAVAYWQQQVANAEFQVTCEAQGVSQFAGCGQGTGLTGQGPVYQVRLADLRKDQAALARAQAQATATKARLSPQIAIRADGPVPGGTAGASRLRGGEGPVRSTDDGLIARWRALGELENASPGVRTEVWLLEGLIIAIDLAAVIAKMTSKTPSYNRVLEAERKKVVLRAVRDEEDAADAVELSRAEREARAHVHQGVLDAQVDVAFDVLDAWKQIARHWIGAWVDEQTGGRRSRTSGASSSWPPNAGPDRQHGHGVPAGVPVNSHSLGGLMDLAQPHERMPVTMPKPLTRMAWLGTWPAGRLGRSAAPRPRRAHRRDRRMARPRHPHRSHGTGHLQPRVPPRPRVGTPGRVRHSPARPSAARRDRPSQHLRPAWKENRHGHYRPALARMDIGPRIPRRAGQQMSPHGPSGASQPSNATARDWSRPPAGRTLTSPTSASRRYLPSTGRIPGSTQTGSSARQAAATQ